MVGEPSIITPTGDVYLYITETTLIGMRPTGESDREVLMTAHENYTYQFPHYIEGRNRHERRKLSKLGHI